MKSGVVLAAALVLVASANGVVAAGTADASATIAHAFECEIGPRHEAAANCFQTVGRYVACFHQDELGNLAAVSVVPAEWLGDGEFDRDDSLSEGECLQIVASISKVRQVGRLVYPDRSEVHVLLNNSYDERDAWENALLVKYVNAWDESVASFYVIYYQMVTGKVVWYRPKDCTPLEPLGMPMDCRDPSHGPYFLSVEGHDYYLAPVDQKVYEAGSEVRVLAADPDLAHQNPKNAKIRPLDSARER